MAAQYAAAFASPKGPGDARPTALQIVQDEKLEGKLEGKVVFITGASAGLGLETARALLATGATLYLTGRDVEKTKASLGDIAASDRVHVIQLDLESLESVRAAAATFLSKSKTLNIFIANAGVMYTPEGRTKEGFEIHLGTNHLSHFLLFNLLKPALLASSTPEFNSRAIILSSAAHRWSGINFENINLDGAYDKTAAYAQSKLANVYTANEIERRYGAQGLHSWAVHPGVVNTSLARHLSEDELSGFVTDPVLGLKSKNAEQGASTTVWAAVGKELEGKGGQYLEECRISTVYDPEADTHWAASGHAAHAYNPESEAKLWAKSLELVRLKEDA